MEGYDVPTLLLQRPIDARPPGSKSLTNRAFIASALCGSPVELRHGLESEDTDLAGEALRVLGIAVKKEGTTFHIRGPLRAASGAAPELFLGNAGTAVRFLSSVLCAAGVPCRIDGTARMRQRPIGSLLDALRGLGGAIESEAGNGCVPLRIGPGGLEGGAATVTGAISSQFFSGLMMAAPLARNETVIRIEGELLSRPYVTMTARLLKDFGVEATVGETAIVIPGGQSYRSPGVYEIEPDASAATYPLGLGVLHGVPVTIRGLGRLSLQGDVAFCDVLEKAGCRVVREDASIHVEPPARLRGVGELDLREIPDAAMTAVTLLAVAEGRSRLTGLRNLKFKECDRLSALETELGRLGAKVKAFDDGFEIEGVPLASLHGAEITTYQDHRMAMCLALLGTRVSGVRILDPGCVAKTYPGFWSDLEGWLGAPKGLVA